MSSLIYSYPSDELLGVAASISLVDGTLDSGYALAGLFDGNQAAAVRFTTDHFAIVIDHGSAVPLEFPQIAHSNLRSSATAALERNDTNSWGSPAETSSFTLTDARRSGLRPNPWIDRRGSGNYRYTKFSASGNGVAILLGQLPFYKTLRQLSKNIAEKPTLLPTTDTVVNKTNARVELKVPRGVQQWSLTTRGDKRKASDLEEMLEWFEACGGHAGNFGMVWDPSKNDAWFASWSEDTNLRHVRYGPAGFTMELVAGWIEQARGQVLP